MDSILLKFSTITLILAILTTIAIWIYWRWIRRKRYTRERFTFVAIYWLIGYFTTITGILIFQNPIFEFIISFLNGFFGTSIEQYQPVELISALIFILISGSIISFTIMFLFYNWNGERSKRQAVIEETGQKNDILKEFWYYIKNKDKIELYLDEEKEVINIFSPTQSDTRSWYLKAQNYFNLSDHQYFIQDKEWYREYNCYLTTYGQYNEKIGIFCLGFYPSEEQLKDCIEFIKSQQGNYNRIIVAVEGKGVKSYIDRFDIKIQIRYESELLLSLIPINRYQKYINEYFYQKTLTNSNLTLGETYVPLNGKTAVLENGKLNLKGEIHSVEDYILSWSANKDKNSPHHLVILGEYGQGKTVLMHRVVSKILDNRNEYSRIPVLIELRGTSTRTEDTLKILSQWANRFQAKSEGLLELHKAGKLLLILDGFDELDLVGDSEVLYNHFKQIWSLAKFPKAKIIISGRPNLFADDEERRKALGIQENEAKLPVVKAIYLDKLTIDQIKGMLKNTNESTRTGILNAVQKGKANKNFVELLTRPSTLYQLSTIWNESIAQKKYALNSASIIKIFIQKTYNRQDKKDTFLTSKERHYFMMGVAVGMMKMNGYSNQIQYKDLKKLVIQLLDNFPAKLDPNDDALDYGTKDNYLPIRLQEKTDPLGTVLKDVQTGGILVQDLSGRDFFKFSHKSYLEYLVSEFYVIYLLQNQNYPEELKIANAIAKTINFNHYSLIQTEDVEKFISELIINKAVLKLNTPNTNTDTKIKKSLQNLLIYSKDPFLGKISPNFNVWRKRRPLGPLLLLLCIINLLIAIVFKAKPDFYLDYFKANHVIIYYYFSSILMLILIPTNMLYSKEESLVLKRLYLNTCKKLDISTNEYKSVIKTIIIEPSIFTITDYIIISVLSLLINACLLWPIFQLLWPSFEWLISNFDLVSNIFSITIIVTLLLIFYEIVVLKEVEEGVSIFFVVASLIFLFVSPLRIYFELFRLIHNFQSGIKQESTTLEFVILMTIILICAAIISMEYGDYKEEKKEDSKTES